MANIQTMFSYLTAPPNRLPFSDGLQLCFSFPFPEESFNGCPVACISPTVPKDTGCLRVGDEIEAVSTISVCFLFPSFLRYN